MKAPLARIEQILRTNTTRYHFYLQDVRTGQTFEFGRKEEFPICSCFKLAVLMAYFDSIRSAAELDGEVVIPPEQASPGGGLVNLFETPVRFTYLQLAQMMMAFSDGTATDVLIRKVGLATVRDVLRTHAPESSLATNLRDMVETFQRMVKNGKERIPSLYKAGRYLIETGSYTNARDLAELAWATERKQYDDPLIHRAYHAVLRIRKLMPRTALFFDSEYRFVGKTGSFGYGFYVNDCGILQGRSETYAKLAYVTEGWLIPRPVVEVLCAEIGLLAARTVGVDVENKNWTYRTVGVFE